MGTCSLIYMEPTPEQVEAELAGWREQEEARPIRRDELVLRAHAAGLSINKIHTISGISRPTIYRILEKS